MIIVNAVLISAVAALVSSVPFGDRGKREPNGRAMTWSGWMPNGGMTLFASSADDMWNINNGLRPPSSTWQDHEFSWKTQQEPVERKLFTENELTTLKPFDDTEDNFKVPRRQPFDDDRERRTYNDKPYSRNKPRKHDDDDEEYDRRSPGSNANASFNAWFPIMLGMYPSDGSRSSPRNHNSNNNNGAEDDGRSLAAIANSVNHGRSGVASSHAVIYTGQPRYNHKNK
ncbi:hypothetical protein O3M35_009612 [Rhynocoris fuscipes]|uniref:Uncharacterized protein n=1 Tax=Rhynocoris fuscipes TaxID=488301 RepID=A0AAW1D770_9HEMI